MKKKKEKEIDFTLEHSYVMDILFISILSLGIFFMFGSFNIIKFANSQKGAVLSAQTIELPEDQPRIIPPRPCASCTK